MQKVGDYAKDLFGRTPSNEDLWYWAHWSFLSHQLGKIEKVLLLHNIIAKSLVAATHTRTVARTFVCGRMYRVRLWSRKTF